MWKVSSTPSNYFPLGGEEWCIIDDDGDVHNFYATLEQAEKAFDELKRKRESSSSCPQVRSLLPLVAYEG
jgi:hypothetical protein